MNTQRLIALLAFSVGCGGSDDPSIEAETDGGTLPVAPDGGADPTQPIGGGCDPMKIPSQEACVLHESLGIFVSPEGNDTNPGTRAKPLRSVGKGIEAAGLAKRRVYVCAGAYVEPTLVLQDGIAMFGNLSCASGQWAVTTQHTIVTSTSTVAARASNIATETRIEGVDLTAAAGVAPGESSIALVAEGSPGLHFVGSSLIAQDAASGANGVEGPQFPDNSAALAGEAAAPERACTPGTGPLGQTVYSCPGRATAAGGAGTCSVAGVQLATNPGGAGGASVAHEGFSIGGGVVLVRRVSNFTVPASYAENADGLPGVATAATTAGTNATYGAAATDTTPSSTIQAVTGATPGAAANGGNAPQVGSFMATGYVPADGVAGADGAPGQGGGGGAGTRPSAVGAGAYRTGTSGSGGGAGGCPGLAGTPGSGGGASIAILAFASPMRIETTLLRAGRGGTGGAGALGSLPRAGGQAGGASGSAGAAGGTGGASGWSGHGGSGPSFAVAWSGAAVAPSADSKVEFAAPREGQPALSGNGKTIPAASPGLAAAVYAIE